MSVRRERGPRHALPDDVLRLQEALLPAGVPLLPSADVAVGYVPAGDPSAVGGDWFDAATLDGRLMLSVGDVVGAGLAAVAVMGQLRAVLSARLFEGAGLTEAIDAAELLAARTSGAAATSLCVAAFDLVSGRFDYVTRGHPAPVVVGPGGVRALPPTGDGPLGAIARRRTGSTRLAVGETVLVFTDGLYARPGEGPVAALTRLHATALKLGADPAGLVARLPAALGSVGFVDDVTLLAVRHREPPSPLDVELTAAAARIAQVRSALDRWGQALGLADDDRHRLLLGVSELVANAVEHAYAGRPAGPVRVHAELTGDATVVASVADEGRWREPSQHPGDRGRGLSMGAALGLRVELDSSDAGTVATVELPARRALHLTTGPAIRRPQLDPATLAVDSDQHPTVRVHGALAAADTAAHLEAEVRRVSRNGLVPVTVDLRGVTHLSSAGIAALVALVGSAGPGDVRVVADPASTVAQLLTLAAIAFTTVR